MNQSIAVFPQSFIQNEILLKEILEIGSKYSCSVHLFDPKTSAVNDFLNLNKPTIVLVGLEKIDSNLLKSNHQLKFVSKFGVGTDNIDFSALSDHSVNLGWTSGVNKRSVSELVLSFALGHCRNVFQSVHKMKSSNWKKEGGKQVSNCKFGIVGFGNIGQDLAKILEPFGCEIFFTDIEKKNVQLKVKQVEYHDLISLSDIISFHVPQTTQTFYMFSKKELDLVKKGAFLINTSRGEVIDFDSAVFGVKEHILSGYAADVFPKEPFDAKDFINDYRFLFTPHIGGNAKEAVLAMGRESIKHISNFLAGNH